jgi:hypothetical protein
VATPGTGRPQASSPEGPTDSAEELYPMRSEVGRFLAMAINYKIDEKDKITKAREQQIEDAERKKDP